MSIEDNVFKVFIEVFINKKRYLLFTYKNYSGYKKFY